MDSDPERAAVSSIWTRDRLQIYERLGEVDESCSAMYRCAVDLLAEPARSGESAARAALIGHCIRELINNLPDALGDVEGMPGRGHTSEAELRHLADVLERDHWMDYRDDISTGDDPRFVTIRSEVLLRAVAVAAEYRAGEGRRQRRDAAMVLGRLDSRDAAMAPWTAARRFFMRPTHLGTTAPPTDEDLLRHLQVIEASLMARLGDFFANLKILSDILADANSAANEGEPQTTSTRFDAPTTQTVDDALARLGSLQTQRAFYGKLLNPFWVSSLAEKGAFPDPSPASATPNAATQMGPWPQGEYLARMAEFIPAEVAPILMKIMGTRNPWVRRSLAAGIALLPAAEAAGFAKGMSYWANDGPSELVDSRDIAQIIINLMESGYAAAGMKLARAYYRPRRPKEETSLGVPEPQVGVEEYMYGQTFPSVARAMGDGRLNELIHWLEDYQRFTNSYHEKSATDSSYIWRPSISRGMRSRHEAGDVLVDAVREAALAQFLTNPDAALSRLMRSNHQLVRRIALDVCAELIEQDSELEPRSDRVALAKAANRLLSDPGHGDTKLRVEYLRLVQACLKLPTLYSIAPVEELVRVGLQNETGAIFAAYKDWNPDETESELQQRVEDYVTHWRHKLLAGVGRDGLTPTMRELLDGLDRRFGPVESPAAPAWEIRDLPIDESALSEADMRAMSDDALLEYLQEWDPESRPESGTSLNATSRVLASVVTSDPTRFVGTGLTKLQALRPTYLCSILSGWRETATRGNAVPWDFALAVASWITLAEDPEVPETESLEVYRHQTMRSAKMEVARLLVEALSSATSDQSLLTEGQREVAADILCSLAAHREDGHRSSDSAMDPLTASFNYVRPEAARGLVRLTRWLTTPETKRRVLDCLLAGALENDPELAIAAVFGEGVGRLYQSALDWLTDNAPMIFGGSEASTPFQQTALMTALSTHSSHPALVTLLRRALMALMNEFGSPVPVIGLSDRRPVAQLVGNWVLTEYVTGRLTEDDPLFTGFYSSASPADRGAVIGHIAWSMMHVAEVSDEVLRRTRRLWEQRVRHVQDHSVDASELGEFYWFIRSRKFEVFLVVAAACGSAHGLSGVQS